MKISKLFHWLYCLVMFLPVLFIPIMAIYSHRHTIDSYSVVRAENYTTEFTYVYRNSFPFPYDDIDSDSGLATYSNGVISLPVEDLNTDDTLYIYNRSTSLNDDSKYYFKFFWDYSHDCENGNITLYVNSSTYENETSVLDEPLVLTGYVSFVFDIDVDFVLDNFNVSFYAFNLDADNVYTLKDFVLIDLTDCFGAGNEPSLAECNGIFNENYYEFEYDYEYTVDVTNTHDVTYNDTDIGSQFVYDTYNVVDKYFNYDKVFNFGNLYTWLQNTFFSGNAPLGFFIFWHLLIYWLLTSILWLIFDVLLYVPSFIHKWLDKASVM